MKYKGVVYEKYGVEVTVTKVRRGMATSNWLRRSRISGSRRCSRIGLLLA